MTIRTLQGDNRETLATLDECSVHMAVTSPPYWALRSYLPADSPLKGFELGQEPTPELFVENLVDVFRSVRRVLRGDATLWVNIADTYAQDGNRVGIPQRFALAMRADGWICRDEIIWHKPAPMPSSVNGWRWEKCRVKVKDGGRGGRGNQTSFKNGHNNLSQKERAETDAQWTDCPGCAKCEKNDGLVLRKGSWRTTAAHEYIFMFAKTASYFCDAEAMRIPSNPDSVKRAYRGNSESHKMTTGAPGQPAHSLSAARDRGDGYGNPTSANPRSVWTITTEPLKAKHYAAFPSELPRRCIRAGTPDKGCCAKCGAPWARIVESKRTPTRPGNDTKITGDRMNDGNRDAQRHVSESRTTGWRPTCGCDAGKPVPCKVLDPFGGSGTTGLVAQMMGRDVVLCELNPDYIDIQRDRCEEIAPLLMSIEAEES